MPKKKQKWSDGDIFIIPLEDGSFSVGQILDTQMTNVVRCALFSSRINDFSDLTEQHFAKEKLISLVAASKEQLDYDVWKVVSKSNQCVPINEYPNEQFRSKGWVGSKIYDASIVEEFLNAFHKLVPWDDWADPNYLDALLIDEGLKPEGLILSKK